MTKKPPTLDAGRQQANRRQLLNAIRSRQPRQQHGWNGVRTGGSK